MPPNFSDSPKVVRSILTLGEVARKVEETVDNAYMKGILDRMLENRSAMSGQEVDVAKTQAYTADGFASLTEYYESNYVELLTFYGDIYDSENGVFHKNRVITVVDRAYVMFNEQNPSWLGKAPIFHAGWRERPDNLYAMGPLDNLVGMQYRIDHLENLKADVFDQIAYPIIRFVVTLRTLTSNLLPVYTWVKRVT